MQTIKLLAISASPRKRGNTAFLMGEALKVLEETGIQTEVRTYSFSGKKIQPCIGCLKCYGNGGNCILKDDFANLRELWLWADSIIYFSPVYVAGIPGQLKCFIDRLNNSEFGLYPVTSVRNMKTIGAVIQGGDFPGGQELCMVDIFRHTAMANCLYVPPDGSYFGSGGWADGPNGIELKAKMERKTPDIALTLETARSIVQRAVELAAILRQGMGAMRGMLERDIRYRPFLERLEVSAELPAEV